MRVITRKTAVPVLLLIMAGVLAPLAGLGAGIAVLGLIHLPGNPAAVVITAVTATALGSWAGVVLSRDHGPRQR